MSVKIIDGRKIAEKIKDKIVKEIIKLPERPNLAIILVGQNPESCLYVSLKEKESKKCGIDVHCYRFNSNISKKELLQCIKFLNNDKNIDGILIQLPLPKKFNATEITAKLNPNKDVDGFHPNNLAKIKKGKNYIMPPLAGAVLEIIKEIKYNLHNKKIVIIGKSNILLEGIGDILRQYGSNIITKKPEDKELKTKAKQADILITALGKKHYLTANYVKKGAVVVDIGIIRENKNTYGDVDFESIKNIAGYVSPVPGGVGPITIALVFRNVLELYKKQKKKER